MPDGGVITIYYVGDNSYGRIPLRTSAASAATMRAVLAWLVTSTTVAMLVGIPTGSPSTINSDHNFYIFRDGASNNNGGVSQYGSYGRSSPGLNYDDLALCVYSDGNTSYGTWYDSEITNSYGRSSPGTFDGNLLITANGVYIDGNVSVFGYTITNSYGALSGH